MRQELSELLSQKEQAENGFKQINAAMDDLNMQKMIQDSIDLIDISIEIKTRLLQMIHLKL